MNSWLENDTAQEFNILEHIVIFNFHNAYLVPISIDVLILLLDLSATCFYCYAIYAMIAFFGRPHPIERNFHPPISILKPVCGLDSDAYENFASFCYQDYPDYQVIFAVRDQHDPVVEIVQKIIEDFPNIDIQLVISDRTIGTNPKVNNLANAAAAAKHNILLTADSDIHVGADYLQRVIQPLRDPRVGVVTCLYRLSVQGWVSMFEALGTATYFHASVLVAKNLQGVKSAFGSTIVLQKAALEAIGGFAAIANTSLLFLIATRGSILGWTGLGITWTVRLAMAWVIGKGLHEESVVKKFLWLVPLRDIVSFILWCYGFVGNSINWRGRRLKLVKGGLLVPLGNDFSKIMSS